MHFTNTFIASRFFSKGTKNYDSKCSRLLISFIFISQIRNIGASFFENGAMLDLLLEAAKDIMEKSLEAVQQNDNRPSKVVIEAIKKVLEKNILIFEKSSEKGDISNLNFPTLNFGYTDQEDILAMNLLEELRNNIIHHLKFSQIHSNKILKSNKKENKFMLKLIELFFCLFLERLELNSKSEQSFIDKEKGCFECSMANTARFISTLVMKHVESLSSEDTETEISKKTEVVKDLGNPDIMEVTSSTPKSTEKWYTNINYYFIGTLIVIIGIITMNPSSCCFKIN